MNFLNCFQSLDIVKKIFYFNVGWCGLHNNSYTVEENRDSSHQDKDREKEGTDWISLLPFRLWLEFKDQGCSYDTDALNHVS